MVRTQPKRSCDRQMEWLKSLATAGIIIGVSIGVYGVVKGVIARLIEKRMSVGNAPQPRVDTLRTLVTSLIGYLIFFIALVAVLQEFQVDATGIIASAGILGLAIGFGAQGWSAMWSPASSSCWKIRSTWGSM